MNIIKHFYHISYITSLWSKVKIINHKSFKHEEYEKNIYIFLSCLEYVSVWERIKQQQKNNIFLFLFLFSFKLSLLLVLSPLFFCLLKCHGFSSSFFLLAYVCWAFNDLISCFFFTNINCIFSYVESRVKRSM